MLVGSFIREEGWGDIPRSHTTNTVLLWVRVLGYIFVVLVVIYDFLQEDRFLE